MSLQFILGGAGTGKSTMLMQRLIRSAMDEPGRRHIILVPEQYTMQTQGNVIRMHPYHAVMNIDILSFERLAYRIMGELGQENMSVLSSMGKNMMLRRICSEHQDELGIYKRSLRKPGFISRLMTMISEFYQYGITSRQLESLQPKLNTQPMLSRKLKDLKVFFDAMEQLKGDNTIAAEELLSLLVRIMSQSEFLKDAYVAIDCFTGFTPVQYQILGCMLKQVSHMEIALLLPREEWREETREIDLFHMSQDTIFHMDRLAGDRGIRSSYHFCDIDLRHKDNPELMHLVKFFLRDGGVPYEQEMSSIRAVSLKNPRQEAAYAAESIRNAVMEGQLRYRDIAVITGDLDEYRPHIENYFRKMDIPVFIDRKKGILGNPLVEYMRSSLETVRTDMSYESVFRFLKSGITVLEAEEQDLLENFCLANRIRGRKRWEEEWSIPESEERTLEINAIRLKVMHVLAPLMESRNLFTLDSEDKHRISLKERTQVLRQMLLHMETAEQMQNLSEEMIADGRPETAQEYVMTFDFIMDLLAQMDELLGEETLSLQEFSDILDAGLAEAKLGMIPQSMDRVQVGDVMRSRLGEIKMLIILGFNEGVIPGNRSGQGILSENERAMLAGLDLVLAPSAEHVANQEQFYLYRLMTAPSQRILIASSRMGGDGSARQRSHLWDRLHFCFPGLAMEEPDQQEITERLSTRKQAWNLWSGNLQQLKRNPEDHILLSLGECLRQEDPELMELILKSAFDPERMDHISRAAAAALYGDTISGSITRLEKYAACAYAHFLSYGLYLQSREDGTFRPTDRGEFFHKFLEYFFRICSEQGVQIEELSEDKRQELIEAALRQAEEVKGVDKLEVSPVNQYLRRRWKILAEHTVDMICAMLEQEEFKPAKVEMRFSGENCSSLRLDLGAGRRMDLIGKVDRLDTMKNGEETFLRVVDYKTGKKELDLVQLYHGLQLQLPMYMEAVLEQLGTRSPEAMIPGGICYYHLEEPLVPITQDEDEESIRSSLMNQLRMKGIILDENQIKESMSYATGQKIGREQFKLLGKHVKLQAKNLGKGIVDGDIQVNPYRYKDQTACSYCEYAGICGFNSRRSGNHYRKLSEMKKDEIWSKLKEENDGSIVDR